MHGGGGFASVRQAAQQMRYAKPWQQALFAVGLLAVGAVLMVTGAWLGVLPLLLGITFTVRCVRLLLSARREAR